MFHIDPQGIIRHIESGAVVMRDVTNALYQRFMHWEQNGRYQEPAKVPVEPAEEPAEDPAPEPKPKAK